MSARFRISHFVLTSSAFLTLSLSLASSGCSSTGGGGGSGGVIPSGSGGTPTGSGGVANSGGGGPVGSGGIVGSGGAPSGSGGATSGGTTGSGGESASGGQTGSGGGPTGAIDFDTYNPDFKEFVGEDCELGEPALLSSANHNLPDPFLMSDGSRMSSVSQWACQRAWLKKLVETYVHGEKPGRPATVTGSVSATAINVHVEDGGGSADFMIPIDRPTSTGAVPGVFQADGSGVPASFLKGEGVAAMSYSHSSAESAYNAVYGSGSVSKQIKWAWFVSRAIDVLVDEAAAGNNDIIDPRGLGTTGCSYAGKSAFTVGAFDERIALGIPVESGTGGLASYRVIADNDIGPNQGENNPEQLSEVCGGSNSGWFSSQFCSTYRNQVDSLPVDAHFMAAMYAPRGFTTLDNDRIGHLAPVAQFTAVSAAAEVFKALGIEKNVGYHGGNDADPHNHCTFYASQEETTRNAIEGFLKRSAPPDNFMEPKLKDGSNQSVDWSLDEYIEWTAPTLN